MIYYLVESPQIIPPENNYPKIIQVDQVNNWQFSETQKLDELKSIEQINYPPGAEPSLQTERFYPQQPTFKTSQIPVKVVPTKRVSPPTSPGVTIQTPSAYGKSWGRASIGFGFQNRTRYGETPDGVLGFGFGLGDAKKAIGIDVSLGIVDVDQFKNGGVSLKFHRQLPEDLAIAVGIKNVATFGTPDGGTSAYLVLSKMFRLQNTEDKLLDRVFFSVGVGGGQFRSEKDVNNQKDSVGVFGSISLQLAQSLNAIAEWTGQDLTIGFSFAPFPDIPIVITPAFTDITGTAGDGHRFILGVGYSLQF
jgi:hypothetical protein